jgi:hypothetical protein
MAGLVAEARRLLPVDGWMHDSRQFGDTDRIPGNPFRISGNPFEDRIVD